MLSMVIRVAIAGSLSVLIAAPWTVTVAQPPFPIPGKPPGLPPGLPPMPPGMGGMMGEGSCPTIDMLKSSLAIKDAQRSAWDAYVAALKSNAQSLHGMRETMMPTKSKTSIDQLDAHLTAMENRLKALRDIKPTLASLYDSLSEDQKRKADEQLLGMSCMM
jgi:hypothetical protein